MGVVRWTAKAMKVTGDILDSDTVEQWLESKARQMVLDRAKQLPARWIAGKSRARRWVVKDARASVKSEAFQDSLTQELARLPAMLAAVARKVRHTSSVAPLEVSDFRHALIAVPRGLIAQAYQNRVVNELQDAAALAEFPVLPSTLLSRLANQSEHAFFEMRERPYPLDERSELVGTDPDQPWGVHGMDGHYYVATTLYDSYKLADKATAKSLREFVDSHLAPMRAAIGKLNIPEVTNIRDRLKGVTID